MVFLSITKQLNLLQDMKFTDIHRIMTRIILEKFISRKSNDKISWKCKKHICGVFCSLGPYALLQDKNTCGGTSILMKVARWSATSCNCIHPKWCKLSQIQNKAHFLVVWVCFSQISRKLDNFQICSFNRRWKHH